MECDYTKLPGLVLPPFYGFISENFVLIMFIRNIYMCRVSVCVLTYISDKQPKTY
jgi:hypothetical protein